MIFCDFCRCLLLGPAASHHPELCTDTRAQQHELNTPLYLILNRFNSRSLKLFVSLRVDVVFDQMMYLHLSP